MKTPPLLLGSALLFWGWQSDFLIVGIVFGAALESARLVRSRWDFSDDDFRRVWSFCSVLFLAAAVYAFTANEGPAEFGNWLREPSVANQNDAGMASVRTATALFRWLPIIFFLFAATHVFSTREEIPWTAVSEISRWRARREGGAAAGLPAAGRGLHVGYAYFGLCLFAACTHPGEGNGYFWGLAALLAWSLWSLRSRRYRVPVWAACFVIAMGLGYAGQLGAGRLQSYLTNLNPEWFGMGRRYTDATRSRTALGRIGKLKLSGEILIRLQPQSGPPPTYLREASYRVYDTPTWIASRPAEEFDTVYETNGTTWLLVPTKPNNASVQIACYLEGMTIETRMRSGLLPLPEGSGRLENLAAFAVKKNSTGAVLAEGPGLVIFDARYGPGPGMESKPDPVQDLSIPTNELPALEQLTAELNLEGKSTPEKLQALYGLFKDRYTYSLWQPLPKSGSPASQTPLSRFLLQTRSGHCEYFATATVLLLRKLGIPARYAVGYVVHEQSGDGYVVRQRDAHAWCLAWDSNTGVWENFDTTPASWVEAEAQNASAWERLSDFRSWIAFQFAKLRWGQSNLRRYILVALVPVLVFLLYRIAFQRQHKVARKRRPTAPAAIQWPGLDSEFYLVEKQLARRGALRNPNEPLSVWLRRATADPALAEFQNSLQSMLRLHYRYRFDPQNFDAQDRIALRQGVEKVLNAMSDA